MFCLAYIKDREFSQHINIRLVFEVGAAAVAGEHEPPLLVRLAAAMRAAWRTDRHSQPASTKQPKAVESSDIATIYGMARRAPRLSINPAFSTGTRRACVI